MNDYSADLEHRKAATAHLKARTANRWIVNTLLWLVAITGIGVLPAAVIAGWRWLL
jgi:hypothetical protein